MSRFVVEKNTMREFLEKAEGVVAILVFTSPFCSACASFSSVLDIIESKYKDNLLIGVADTENDGGLSDEMDVEYLPTTLFFSTEGVVVAVEEGSFNLEKFNEIYEKIMENK